MDRLFCNLSRWVAFSLLTSLSFMCAGCGVWPKDVNAKLGQSMNDAGTWEATTVHLVGTSDRDKIKTYRTMSMTEYWSATGRSRQADSDRKELRLGPEATSVTLSRKDPIWGRWLENKHPLLFVLADL